MVAPILQFGIPAGPEMIIILLIAVLLFGANKIPKLARSTGEAMGEFQKGREQVEQELDEIRESGSTETTSPAVEAGSTDAGTTSPSTETTETAETSQE